MSETASHSHVSPFESIKHADEQGEYWSARELSKVLDYKQWQKFHEKVIERAKDICRLMQQDIALHFADESARVTIGSGAERDIIDYRLTKYATYLVLLCSDVRKPEVARAISYIALTQLDVHEIGSERAQYIPLSERIALTKEQKTIGQIARAFKHLHFVQHYRVAPYYVDLYFPDHNLVIECDEGGHQSYKPSAEHERQRYIERALGCEFVRYNPDERDFNIGDVMNRIMRLVYA